MSKDVRSLEPKVIWNYFEDLNATPRGSKKEAKVIEFLKEFGKKHNLDTTARRWSCWPAWPNGQDGR